MGRAMREQKKSPDFGQPSAAVKEAIAVFRRVYVERQEPPYDRDVELAGEVIAAETTRRLLLLLSHYGIDPAAEAAYPALALALALHFVKGFDVGVALTRGRPKSVLGEHEALAEAVDTIMEKTDCSASAACKKLGQRNGPWHGEKKEALEAKYNRYKGALKAEFAATERARAALMWRIAMGQVWRLKRYEK